VYAKFPKGKKTKSFEAFLKQVKGIEKTRAYDCMRIAGDRTTDEEIRKETLNRVKKCRDNKKLLSKPPVQEVEPPKVEPPKVEPPEISVTVTEKPADETSAEATAEPREAENVAMTDEEKAAQLSAMDAEEKAVVKLFGVTAEELSADNLQSFKFACRNHLPKLSEFDLKEAKRFVTLGEWRPEAEAA
jgi:hypothetical protein